MARSGWSPGWRASRPHPSAANPVDDGETWHSLVGRIHQLEVRLLPSAVRALAEKKVPDLAPRVDCGGGTMHQEEGAFILLRMAPSRYNRELLAEEDRLWAELHRFVDSLPEDKVELPGYFAEGWAAKDLVAHIGSWLAEAGVVLERIRFGTYRPEEIDIDAMNQVFFDLMHEVAFADVRAQASAARSRMLSAWGSLTQSSPEADRWISKAGPEHYAEHLPRLREWVEELSR